MTPIAATTTATSLTVEAMTPQALLTAGLSEVLARARPPAPAVIAAVVAVPVRGHGADLAALFRDLAGDLHAQLEEWGAALDQITVDGVLRTETGAYTAWGYLTGPAPTSVAPLLVTLSEVRITEGEPLNLTFTVLGPPAGE